MRPIHYFLAVLVLGILGFVVFAPSDTKPTVKEKEAVYHAGLLFCPGKAADARKYVEQHCPEGFTCSMELIEDNKGSICILSYGFTNGVKRGNIFADMTHGNVLIGLNSCTASGCTTSGIITGSLVNK